MAFGTDLSEWTGEFGEGASTSIISTRATRTQKVLVPQAVTWIGVCQFLWEHPRKEI